MKIRTGFVSNSSSSSFILFGKSFEYLPQDYEPNIWAVGSYLGDGQDIFEVTQPIWKVIVKYCLQNEFSFIKAICPPLDQTMEVNPRDIKTNFNVFTFDRDYHGCESADDVLNRYQKKWD